MNLNNVIKNNVINNNVINNNEKVSDINAVNQVDLIINLLNTINLKLDKVLSKNYIN